MRTKIRIKAAVVLSSLTATLVSSGCGGGKTFTSAELQVIRTELGPLPQTPPADRTNGVAEDGSAAALGQKLFFEDRYSDVQNNNATKISCATCHPPETEFQDTRANTSEGLAFTVRHAPTVINSAYGAADGSTVWYFWDGRTDSQWAQALAPPESDVEMQSSRTRIAKLILEHYRADYEAVFGPLPGEITADLPGDAKPGTASWDALTAAEQEAITGVYVNFGKAIAAYERRLLSRNARFDRFWEEIAAGAPDSDVLTEREKEGLKLFIGKAACIECHDGPNFTDGLFHNVGVSQEGPNLPAEDPGRAEGVAAVTADEFNCAGDYSDHPDKSECAVQDLSTEDGDLGAFKTPSLREVTGTAPYMHTGTFETLDDVIEHYDRGGDEDGFVGALDEEIFELNLSAAEKAALAAFLETLEGEALDASLVTAPELP